MYSKQTAFKIVWSRQGHSRYSVKATELHNGSGDHLFNGYRPTARARSWPRPSSTEVKNECS